MIAVVAVVVVVVLVAAGVFASGILNKKNDTGTNTLGGNGTGDARNPKTVNSTAFATAGSGTIGSSGGTISGNTAAASGVMIEVPSGALSESVSFNIYTADPTTSSGLPAGATFASKIFRIQTSGSAAWNEHKMFEQVVKVTLPYSSTAVDTGLSTIRFYQYDPEANSLEPCGIVDQDYLNNTITFEVGTFSEFVAVRTTMDLFESMGASFSVSTGFLPAVDGWFIDNYGSYLASGGVCLGMTAFAKWYFTFEKGTGTGLYNMYREGDVNQWRDDATAIELATRAHLGTGGIWASLTANETIWAKANAREVGYSILQGMLVSGEPQMLGLKTRYNDGTWGDGSHAVLVYGYQNGHFLIYDPNYHGSTPSDNMRWLPFNSTAGFTQIYVSGTSAADPNALKFNIFYHASAKVFSNNAAYKDLYDAAKKGFKDNTWFPEVKLTDASSNPAGDTPKDTDSDGIRDTTQTKATISGTVKGGRGIINTVVLYVSNQKFVTPVTQNSAGPVADGTFSQEVPLYQGDNDVIVLATSADTFSDWAGFHREVIRCTGSEASFTITMTWGQDNSDVDLHVKEPTINGTGGRHIFYDNKGFGSGGPYLDFDNIYGYGPEHYIAESDSKLPNSDSLYGKYLIRVHYYRDKDTNTESVQGISFSINIRYLVFKYNDGREIWESETFSGYLGFDNPTAAYDFASNDPSWSQAFEFEYKQPNPSNYSIPAPPQNVLP
jgi:uncharacterized protein YfaP (DUF2135 family)